MLGTLALFLKKHTFPAAGVTCEMVILNGFFKWECRQNITGRVLYYGCAHDPHNEFYKPDHMYQDDPTSYRMYL